MFLSCLDRLTLSRKGPVAAMRHDAEKNEECSACFSSDVVVVTKSPW